MKIKLPYTFSLLSPIIGWAILCSAFAYVLVLAIAPFNQESARYTFVVTSPIFVLLFCFLGIMRYGGIGFWAGDDVRLINKNINKKGIAYNIPTDEVKDTFNALVFICRTTFINVLASSLSVIVLIILMEWINQASFYDLTIIICGGIVATFFSCAFATFFCQQSIFSIIKDCRRILIERGEIMEVIELSGISSKFQFLFFLPLITILILLVAVYPVNLNVLILSLIGLTMTFIIDWVLFTYINNSFKELEKFAEELPTAERAVFATGSLDKEIVNLAQSLNQASEEVYHSRHESEKSKEELEKRIKELEKFFNLTINREVKMIELKNKIKELKKDVQEDDI